MTSTARRYSVSNPPPTSGLLQGRETQQEAEVLELLAAQASRDGDESKAIQLMERALQIRCHVVASLGEKAHHCQDAAAAAVSSTTPSPTNSVVAQRQRQEAASAASESRDQYQLAANELYDAAERLVTHCNVFAVQSFKKGDYEAAEGLLTYCLQLTEDEAYPLSEVGDRRRHLRGTTLNNYGSLERHRGHFRKALQHFETSMHATGAESPVAYMNMSAVLVQLRQCDEAAEAAARAVALLSHTPEEPSLLAVAHHNYAMALEPVDPSRSLEEYATAYQTACATMGTNSAATLSILQNWERFRRHHPHLASGSVGGGHTPAALAHHTASGATTPRLHSPSKALRQPEPRTPTPPHLLSASHAPGRQSSRSPSLATSAAVTAVAAPGASGRLNNVNGQAAAAAAARRTAADPTAADLAEIFPHPFLASASLPKATTAPHQTPMYRPSMSAPRKPLVPLAQPHARRTSPTATHPPPMRHQRSPAPTASRGPPRTSAAAVPKNANNGLNFAATVQPVRQKPGKAAASTTNAASRPTRPATASTVGAPPGHYVVGGQREGKTTASTASTSHLAPVRPLTSGKTGASEGKSSSSRTGRVSPRDGSGGQSQRPNGLLRAQRPPEKRPSAVGRHALPPLSSAADTDDQDVDSLSASTKRRSTRPGTRRDHASMSSVGPHGGASAAAGGGGDLQFFMNDRLDMLLHDEEEFERKYDKAVTIQRAYRGHLARSKARTMRANESRDARLHAIRRNIAARQIQRAYREAQYGLYASTVRRLVGPKVARKDRGQWSREALAAVEMQRMARGWLARRDASRRRAYEANAEPAAVRLQTWYRGKLAQRELQRLRQAQIELRRGYYGEQYDYAAARIQSQWRAHRQYQLARAELEARRLHRLRERQRRQTEAAACVQRGWRCARARREAARLRAARDDLEAQRRAYEAQRQAAIRIQSFGRMVIVQQRAHPGLNEARQRAAHKVRYARQNWAARTIQCAYRRYAAQLELQRRREAFRGRRHGTFQEIVVRRLQRVGRGYLERLAISAMGDALAAEALRYIRGVANLREQDARAAAQAQAAHELHKEQKQARHNFSESEEMHRMELELCESRQRRQLSESEADTRPACSVVTTHTRVFPEGDWEPALQRHPDRLRDAFIADLVEACELPSAEPIRSVSMSLGSLRVSYALVHSSAVPPSWFDAKADCAAFHRLHGVRARACQEVADEHALALAALEAEAMQAAAALAEEEMALALALDAGAAALQERYVAAVALQATTEDVAPSESDEATDALASGDVEVEHDTPATSQAENHSASQGSVAIAPTVDSAALDGATDTARSAAHADALHVPMTLDEALAAERAKRAANKAEELRLQALREAREEAKQAFRQQRIAEATTEAELAPYLPGTHTTSQGPLSKATFHRSMRPDRAGEASAAAKEVAAHHASEAQAMSAATAAAEHRRDAAATTIARAYRGHRGRLYRQALAELRDDQVTHRVDYEYRHTNPYVQYAQLRQHLGVGARLPTEVNPPSKRLPAAAAGAAAQAADLPPSHPAAAPPPPAARTEVVHETIADIVESPKNATANDPSACAPLPRDPHEVLGGFVKVVEAKRERQMRLAHVQSLMAAAATPVPTPTAAARPVKPALSSATEHKLGDSHRALEGVATPHELLSTPLRRPARPTPRQLRATPLLPAMAVMQPTTEASMGAEVSRTSLTSTSQASARFALAPTMSVSPRYPVEPDVVVPPEGVLGAAMSPPLNAGVSQASAHFALTSPMAASPASTAVDAGSAAEAGEEATAGTHITARQFTQDAAARKVQAFMRGVAARRELASLREAQWQRNERALAAEALLDGAATAIQRVYRGHRGRVEASAMEAAHRAYLAEYMARALAEDAEETEEDLSQQFSERVRDTPSRSGDDNTEVMESSFQPHDTLPYAEAAKPLRQPNAAESSQHKEEEALEDNTDHDGRPTSSLAKVPDRTGVARKPAGLCASAPCEGLAGPAREGPPPHMMTYPSEDAVVREVRPDEADPISSESWEL